MVRYFLGRLLLSVPTLVGVTLVSFALLALAPPPSRIALGIDVQEYARGLFLDLPLFFNERPRDLTVVVTEMLDAPADSPPTPRELALMSRRGTVLIPILVPRLAALAPVAQRTALDLLAPLEAQFGDPSRLETAQDEVNFWGEIYEARRLEFRRSYIRRLANRLANGTSAHVREDLLGLGTYAVGPVIETLDRESRPVAIRKFVELLRTALPEAPAARFDPTDPRAKEAWLEWWFVHEKDYRKFGDVERTFSSITETRYGKWVERLLTLRLGSSLRDGSPILSKLTERTSVTITLAAIAAIVAFLFAVPIGVGAARDHRGRVDRTIGIVSFVVYSMPVVWVATLLMRFLCGEPGLSVFPDAGLSSPGMEHAALGARIGDFVWHATLPVLCLAYPSMITLSRFQRTAVLDVIRDDFVRTARAKGLSENVVMRRHVLRNALLPVLTLAGFQVPLLIGTSVVVEEIFSIPGLGRETVEAVVTRDVPWLVAVTVIGAVVSIAGVLLTDILYSFVDPRTRRARTGSAFA
ncbi:MAG: ABC transporter permease [Sandaracinaceae bacterium]|nr:ABC transporter permease [Sandaracinaceae bacterium]